MIFVSVLAKLNYSSHEGNELHLEQCHIAMYGHAQNFNNIKHPKSI